MDAEERALLAAIIAHPAEDMPRLMYADWLDEHADALPKSRRDAARAKAELIRLEIEEAALVLGTSGFSERYRAIEARRRELSGHQRAWVAELERLTPTRGLGLFLRRGLFGEVRCTMNWFVEHGAALFAAAPVTRVRFKRLTGSNVVTLSKCPHFDRVRTLKMYCDEVTRPVLRSLLDRVPLGHLRGLYLDCWLVGAGRDRADALAEEVAGCSKLAHLKRLSFAAAGLGSDGGRALAASPYLANLEILDLRNNPRLLARATVRKRFGKRVWLDYDDVQGIPIGYQSAD
jgi:uncharacterized protein (TIGR02996 family)